VRGKRERGEREEREGIKEKERKERKVEKGTAPALAQGLWGANDLGWTGRGPRRHRRAAPASGGHWSTRGRGGVKEEVRNGDGWWR